VLAAQTEPLQLTLYVTPATLPPDLAAAPAALAALAEDLAAKSGGKLAFSQIDPGDPSSGVSDEDLFRQYGIQPLATSFFSPDSFYLHLVLTNPNAPEEGVQVIYPQSDMSEGALRSLVENALLRTASGFLPVVGLWTPPATPTQDMFGQMQPPLQSYELLRDQLAQNYTVRTVDLSSGAPPADVDVLLLVAPQNLDDKARFAVDQFLMRGGAVRRPGRRLCGAGGPVQRPAYHAAAGGGRWATCSVTTAWRCSPAW
jgi:ABC-2 type transport system permease protein